MKTSQIHVVKLSKLYVLGSFATDFILSQFVTLWETYDSARGSIPKGNLVKAPRLTQLAQIATLSSRCH